MGSAKARRVQKQISNLAAPPLNSSCFHLKSMEFQSEGGPGRDRVTQQSTQPAAYTSHWPSISEGAQHGLEMESPHFPSPAPLSPRQRVVQVPLLAFQKPQVHMWSRCGRRGSLYGRHPPTSQLPLSQAKWSRGLPYLGINTSRLERGMEAKRSTGPSRGGVG